ncbi:hypothetical protein BH10BDE1_BH10BDE1_16740 [soil metagenome]
MRKLSASLVVLSLLVLQTGCSNSDTTAASSTSAVVTGVQAVSAKLNSAASVINTPSAFSGSQLLAAPMAGPQVGTFNALDTAWTTASGVGNLSNGANYSLKEWFTDEFNPNFKNNNGAKVTFVGRISSSLAIICYLGALGFPTDATNLPTVGTHTGTLTTAQATSCGDASVAGTAITLTASALTDTTLYDRAFSVDIGRPLCPFKFNARVSSSAINIATSEDQHCEGRDQASAAVVLFDRTNNKMRFTYISQGFTGSRGFEFYRGYYNASTDQSYVLGSNSGDDGTAGEAGLDHLVAYTVVGKPTAGGTVAVSAKSKAQNAVADGVYNGCINPSTKAMVSSTDTLVCTMTGTDISTPFTNKVLAARNANHAIADIYTISATTTVGFTDETDMF